MAIFVGLCSLVYRQHPAGAIGDLQVVAMVVIGLVAMLLAASLATYAAVNLRAFLARTGNLLSIENPTFSARMMVAIVSKRGLAPGASVL